MRHWVVINPSGVIQNGSNNSVSEDECWENWVDFLQENGFLLRGLEEVEGYKAIEVKIEVIKTTEELSKLLDNFGDVLGNAVISKKITLEQLDMMMRILNSADDSYRWALFYVLRSRIDDKLIFDGPGIAPPLGVFKVSPFCDEEKEPVPE